MLQSLFKFTTESEKDGNWEIKGGKKRDGEERQGNTGKYRRGREMREREKELKTGEGACV